MGLRDILFFNFNSASIYILDLPSKSIFEVQFVTLGFLVFTLFLQSLPHLEPWPSPGGLTFGRSGESGF